MTSRNVRHNLHPAVDHLPLAGRGGAVTRIWRRRTEILLVAVVVSLVVVAFRAHVWWGFGVVTGMVAVPVTLRRGRNRLKVHFWCVYSRHRMRRLFLGTPLRTRKGRIPLILWITPTPEGEKALVLCRVGICAETFEAFAGEIAAACGATSARIARHRKWANLVTVEIIRRGERPVAPSAGMNRRISDPYAWEPLGDSYPGSSPDPFDPPHGRPDDAPGARYAWR
ncbi:hypothetical protein [Sphaerisporangium corydalis]|uniref:PrgI family protein n=1 Tax=Sphaerisporangium corydalis TaxID=1441875 RepID=A0ABV9EIR2_9ACTN|nr:hypothetical protein [Sphaerisporangium corydalis]